LAQSELASTGIGGVAGGPPSHVRQAVEATAVESILDPANSITIFSLEQALPAAIEPELQRINGDEICAREVARTVSRTEREKTRVPSQAGRGRVPRAAAITPMYDGSRQEGDYDHDFGYGGRDGQGECLDAEEGES
jgi:hypothetical protein